MASSTPEKKVEFISRDQVPELYRLLEKLLVDHHKDVAAEEPKIALAWMYDVKADRDDILTWGKAKKCGDLDKQLHGYDFVISLNFTVWQTLPPSAREALLDHELTHCAVAVNEAGEASFYVRKHDLEEFTEIIRRYGLWRDAVKQFVDAALGKTDPTLFDDKAVPEDDLSPRAAAAVKDFVDTVKKHGHDVTLSVPGVKSVTIKGAK